MQINRFCASGLDAVNLAAAQVMAGQKDIAIGGGVESMSRVGMGASGGAWPVDPGVAIASLLHAAGHLGRPDRHEIRLLPRRRRRLRGREPEARRAGLGRGALRQIGRAGHATSTASPSSTATSTCGRRPTCSRSARSRPPSCRWARWAASTPSPSRRIPRSRRQPCPPCRQLLRHRRRRRRRARRLEEGRRGGGPEAARAHPRLRLYRLRAGADADRPGRRDRTGAAARPA